MRRPLSPAMTGVSSMYGGGCLDCSADWHRPLGWNSGCRGPSVLESHAQSCGARGPFGRRYLVGLHGARCWGSHPGQQSSMHCPRLLLQPSFLLQVQEHPQQRSVVEALAARPYGEGLPVAECSALPHTRALCYDGVAKTVHFMSKALTPHHHLGNEGQRGSPSGSSNW